MSVMFFVYVILFWLSALGIWWGCTRAFRKADVDRFKNRLQGATKALRAKAAGPALLHAEQRPGMILSIMERLRLRVRLQELIEQAGLKWTIAKLGNATLFLLLSGSLGGWWLLPPRLHNFAFLPGLVAGVIPILYVLRKRKSRLRRFEEIFPEALEFVARSMRAGHAFAVSIEMIHREFQEPLASEFRRTFEEHNLGLPLDLALQKLAKRIPSLDVHFFVSAVLLQKRTGGNLAEILDKLATIIRERFKLRGKIRAISAHGRMTGVALTLIPIAVGVVMFFANPDYVKFFFLDDIGNIMLGAVIVLQITGYLIIRQIVKIEI